MLRELQDKVTTDICSTSSLSPRSTQLKTNGVHQETVQKRITTHQILRKMSADPFIRALSPPRTQTRNGTTCGGLHLQQPSMYDTLNHLPVIVQSVSNQFLVSSYGLRGCKGTPRTPRTEHQPSPNSLMPAPIAVSEHCQMNRETPGSHGTSGPHPTTLGSPAAAVPMPPSWRAPYHSASQLDASHPPNSATAASEIYKRACIVPGYSDKLEAEVRAPPCPPLLSLRRAQHRRASNSLSSDPARHPCPMH